MKKYKLDFIKRQLKKPLPGWEAQKLMAPTFREEEIKQAGRAKLKSRKSAVLILLYEKKGQFYVPFIRRSEYKGVHSGQISLPGGQFEETDSSFENTARRETEEEIGISRDEIVILGQISDLYIPPSNFLVKPFVGYLSKNPEFITDPTEVQKLIEIPLAAFYAENVIGKKDFISSSTHRTKKAPYYEVNNVEIWGATAMIISELLEIIR